MSLDYTEGCVNFRDVGTFLNWIAEKPIFPEKKIYRGGSIDYIKTAHEIGNPKSIINLRNGHDSESFGADYYHFPMANKYEKYDTSQKEVRTWLNSIIQVFETDDLAYPVFIHCLSGKDRTGIIIAALLWIAGINEKTIIEEYLLSDGEVTTQRIQMALNGIKNHKDYFNRVNLPKVKQNLINQ